MGKKRKNPPVTWRKHSKLRRYVSALLTGLTGAVQGPSAALQGAVTGWGKDKGNVYHQKLYNSYGSPVRKPLKWVGSSPTGSSPTVTNSPRIRSAKSAKSPSKAPKPPKLEVFKADKVGLTIRKSPDIYLGKQSFRMKTIGTFQYRNMTQKVMESGNGSQIVDHLEIVNTRDMLLGDTDNSRSVTTKVDVDFFKLNPYWLNPTPAGGIYNPGTAVAQQDSICLRNVKMTYRILSMKSIPQEAHLIFVTPKFDVATDPITLWQKILDNKALGQSPSVMPSVLGAATATGGTEESYHPGSMPYYQKEWNKHWRIIKDVKMLLQTGEQINVSFNIKYNKFITREHIQERTNQYLKNLTVYPILVVNSGMVGLRSSDTVDSSEVSFGGPKVGVISEHHYTFRALPINKLSTARAYIGTIAGGTSKRFALNDEELAIDTDLPSREG